MATVQSEVGPIRIFEDFTGGNENPIAETTDAPIDFPPYFQLVGNGMTETDHGAILLDSDGLSGVLQLQCTNESEHACGLQTAKMFDVALMGTLVAECRVRFAAPGTSKSAFFGFTDVVSDQAIIEGGIVSGTSSTLTLTATDICGFLMQTDLTDSTDWHMVYNGGSTTGATTSTGVDADAGAVAGDFQILRVEIDNNGTARWFIDGVLKQTKAGAISTSDDICAKFLVEEKATGNATADLDYILIEANRDWTV